MTKPAQPMSATEIAADLVETWHQEFFGLRIADWKLGELTRRIADAIASQPSESIREKVCLAYQGDTVPCATPCLHCDRIARALQEPVSGSGVHA